MNQSNVTASSSLLSAQSPSCSSLQIQNSLIVTVFDKSLRISSSARQESTIGEIVNLMSVDAQKVNKTKTTEPSENNSSHTKTKSAVETIQNQQPQQKEKKKQQK